MLLGAALFFFLQIRAGNHPHYRRLFSVHPVALRMKCQSAKAKGRRLQQKVASDIVTTFPGLSPDDVRSVSMGCNGEDVLMSPLARTKVPFSIECKNTERLSIWSAIEQCKQNASGHPPLVVFKKNHSEMYATLPWKSLLALLGAPRTASHDPPDLPPSKRRRIAALLGDAQQLLMSSDPLADDAMETDTREGEPHA